MPRIICMSFSQWFPTIALGPQLLPENSSGLNPSNVKIQKKSVFIPENLFFRKNFPTKKFRKVRKFSGKVRKFGLRIFMGKSEKILVKFAARFINNFPQRNSPWKFKIISIWRPCWNCCAQGVQNTINAARYKYLRSVRAKYQTIILHNFFWVDPFW